jgi:hypothetical protein
VLPNAKTAETRQQAGGRGHRDSGDGKRTARGIDRYLATKR